MRLGKEKSQTVHGRRYHGCSGHEGCKSLQGREAQALARLRLQKPHRLPHSGDSPSTEEAQAAAVTEVAVTQLGKRRCLPSCTYTTDSLKLNARLLISHVTCRFPMTNLFA